MKVLMIGGRATPGFFGDGNAPYFLAGSLAPHCSLVYLPLMKDYLRAPRPHAPFHASRRPRPVDVPRAVAAIRSFLKDRRMARHEEPWSAATWYLIDHALTRRYLRWKPDLVHLQTDEWRGLPALRAAMARGIPIVVTVHLPYGLDPSVRRPFDLSMQAEFLHDVVHSGGHVVCVSSRNRERILSAYGLPEGQVHVVRNGVHVPAAVPRGRKRAILQVGSLNPRKNHVAVIEALEPGDDLEYWIVGDGEMREHLEAAARKRDVADQVRFLGRVDEERLQQLYGQASALVLPSLSEGFSLVMLEALAHGLPVVGFDDIDGLQELEADDSKILVARDGLRAGILQALETEWDREEIRRTAEQYSWQAAAEQYLHIYRQVKH